MTGHHLSDQDGHSHTALSTQSSSRAVHALIDATVDGAAELARSLTAQLGRGSWTLLVDRLGGVVVAEPRSAERHARALVEVLERLWGRAGSALGEVPEQLVLLQTLPAHRDLVLAVGVSDLDAEQREVINTAARLMSVVVAGRRRMRRTRAALNAGVLELLLTGEHAAARAMTRNFGGLPTEPIRVFRTQAAATVRQAALDLAWRTVAEDGLVTVSDSQIVAMVPADGPTEARLREALRSPETRRVRVGASDPAPLSQTVAAFREAGHALNAARPGDDNVVYFGDLAEERLLGLIPRDRLLAWAATTLRNVLEHPDTGELTDTLYAWLRMHGRVSTAAAELGVDRRTVERRINLAERLLGADLDDECVRIRLHLALHSLDRTDERPQFAGAALDPARDCLVFLLDIDGSIDWAAAVMKPLRAVDPDGRLRRTLEIWLRFHGDFGRTAEALNVHRNTVSKRLRRIEAATGQNLDYVGNRGELYLALLTDNLATAGAVVEMFAATPSVTANPILFPFPRPWANDQ